MLGMIRDDPFTEKQGFRHDKQSQLSRQQHTVGFGVCEPIAKAIVVFACPLHVFC